MLFLPRVVLTCEDLCCRSFILYRFEYDEVWRLIAVLHLMAEVFFSREEVDCDVGRPDIGRYNWGVWTPDGHLIELVKHD